MHSYFWPHNSLYLCIYYKIFLISIQKCLSYALFIRHLSVYFTNYPESYIQHTQIMCKGYILRGVCYNLAKNNMIQCVLWS